MSKKRHHVSLKTGIEIKEWLADKFIVVAPADAENPQVVAYKGEWTDAKVAAKFGGDTLSPKSVATIRKDWYGTLRPREDEADRAERDTDLADMVDVLVTEVDRRGAEIAKLTDALNNLQQKFNLLVTAIHVNHILQTKHLLVGVGPDGNIPGVTTPPKSDAA